MKAYTLIEVGPEHVSENVAESLFLTDSPFVRQADHDEDVKALRAEVARAAALAQWTFGLLASSILGTIVVFVVSAVTGS